MSDCRYPARNLQGGGGWSIAGGTGCAGRGIGRIGSTSLLDWSKMHGVVYNDDDDVAAADSGGDDDG